MADNQRICSVDGCNRPFFGKGLCQSHLRNLRLYGDPLTSRNAMRGSTWNFFEQVILGYKGDDCLIWPFGGKAYPQIMKDRKLYSVTWMACEARNGPPPEGTNECAHSCGNGGGGCVNPNHLRWATYVENNRDRYQHGTMPLGSKSGTAKITEDQARYIKSMRGIVSERKLAAQFGISSTAVRYIHIGRNWGWLE